MARKQKRNLAPMTSAEREDLMHMLQDPKLVGKPGIMCSVCSRVLTDPDSIAAGIGPECAKNLGVDSLEDV